VDCLAGVALAGCGGLEEVALAVLLLARDCVLVVLQEEETVVVVDACDGGLVESLVDGLAFVEYCLAPLLQALGPGEVFGLRGEVGDAAVRAEAVSAVGDVVEAVLPLVADDAVQVVLAILHAHLI
jgi:hypothetical protein